eukprot:5593627-Pleurochrysis_carterae.AAC.1
MVPQFCIASHAYLRSARAPLPKLLEIRSRWPPLPSRATSSSHPVGATQPPRLRLLPAPDGLYCTFPSLSARPDGSSGSTR